MRYTPPPMSALSNIHPHAAYWLALSYIVRGSSLKKIYEFFSNGEAAWRAGHHEFAQAGIKSEMIEKIIATRPTLDPETLLATMRDDGIEMIDLRHDGYPHLLKRIPDWPAFIFVRGNIQAANNHPLAVVGTRHLTTYGKSATIHLTRALAGAGCTIVSGLARGVDALAHEATIETGGQTVAVIGSGLDKASLYPREHWSLAKTIAERNGAVISEYPPGTKAERYHFPERNRLIAGLSLGTVVIEAPEKSGALITAYTALDYNREVFAVPGSIFENSAVGSNKLIQRGAKLVAGIGDVLETFGWVTKQAAPKKAVDFTPDEQIIIDMLSQTPVHIEILIEKSGLPFASVAAALSLLELKDAVKDLGAKNYIKI